MQAERGEGPECLREEDRLQLPRHPLQDHRRTARQGAADSRAVEGEKESTGRAWGEVVRAKGDMSLLCGWHVCT